MKNDMDSKNMTITAQHDRSARPYHHGHALAGILGPAFVAAVAYVDPGNVAANITSGARYGYLLVWVLVLANCMSVLSNTSPRNSASSPAKACRKSWANGLATRAVSCSSCRLR